MEQIRYRGGYKYQLAKTYSLIVAVYPEKKISTRFIELTPAGHLTIKSGYAWDGPSGPSIDTKNFMRGSLVHDALYQLMREKHLAQTWRKAADDALYLICLEDDMFAIRAWWVFQGVRFGGGPSANPDNERPILIAP